MPQVRTLEYAGACIQTRQVGGDYYDFLDLGRGRLGLVIADIAGKGIAAALLKRHAHCVSPNVTQS
jgi:serine phosphatase RsbU (regulator of sigma subunit)